MKAGAYDYLTKPVHFVRTQRAGQSRSRSSQAHRRNGCSAQLPGEEIRVREYYRFLHVLEPHSGYRRASWSTKCPIKNTTLAAGRWTAFSAENHRAFRHSSATSNCSAMSKAYQCLKSWRDWAYRSSGEISLNPSQKSGHSGPRTLM